VTPTTTVLTKSFPEDKLLTAKTAVKVAGYGPHMPAAARPRPCFIPVRGVVFRYSANHVGLYRFVQWLAKREL
jgi:hypothetical protein